MICPNPECPDRLVNGFPGEYVESMTTCPVCHTALVAQTGAGDSDTVIADGDVEIVEVFSSPFPAEVTVVRTILDGAGIPYLLAASGDHTFPGFTGSIGTAGEFVIRVRAGDVAAVTALLEELDSDPEADSSE